MESLDYVNLSLTIAELDPGIFVVTASGELDVWTASKLDERLVSVVDRATGPLIVDLTAVPLLDSVVLGVLVRHAKHLRAGGNELMLVSDDPRTVRVIEITGLDYLFQMKRSLADALGVGDAAA